VWAMRGATCHAFRAPICAATSCWWGGEETCRGRELHPGAARDRLGFVTGGLHPRYQPSIPPRGKRRSRIAGDLARYRHRVAQGVRAGRGERAALPGKPPRSPWNPIEAIFASRRRSRSASKDDKDDRLGSRFGHGPKAGAFAPAADNRLLHLRFAIIIAPGNR